MAAHAQVNGHMPAMPAQGQKGVSLTTAQKIAALNEQVWLSIGKATSDLSPSLKSKHAFKC